MLHKLPYDTTDLLFRVLFSLIFLGLGMEHLFADALIQTMMPDWLEAKRLVSILSGLILLTGGCSVMFGYKTTGGAILLLCFLAMVTATVHAPAVLSHPEGIPADWAWLWEVYQRSNLVKNLCLMGVCFHLINHDHGRYSLDSYLERRNAAI